MVKKVLAIVLGLTMTAGIAQGAKSVEAMKTSQAKKGMFMNYRQIPFRTIDGKETNLEAFDGKVILVVNVASECGYTPQYEGLEKLYEKYKDKGFAVVGFPANNFGGQEPGSDSVIKEFCTSKFHVTFPMMSKVSVAGDSLHPLFEYLTTKSTIPGAIKWNFSKFLLDQKGRLVTRWPSKVEPMSADVTEAIEKLLK
jgi:glutathione peroxidase